MTRQGKIRTFVVCRLRIVWILLWFSVAQRVMLYFPPLLVFYAHPPPLLQDFTINGQAVDNIEDVDEDNALESFRDILLYVYGERRCPGDAPCRTSGSLALWSAIDCAVKPSG